MIIGMPYKSLEKSSIKRSELKYLISFRNKNHKRFLYQLKTDIGKAFKVKWNNILFEYRETFL